MGNVAKDIGLGLLVWLVIPGMCGAAQQAARGVQARQKAQRPNQVAANNGNVVNPAVQQLLQQFDTDRNGVLDGEELVQVAAAFQQLARGRMGQAGGGAGIVQGGAGQGFGNQGMVPGMGGADLGNANGANQHRFQHGQGGGGRGGGERR
jgi:hypothetical protein